jgi:hypothetical protein
MTSPSLATIQSGHTHECKQFLVHPPELALAVLPAGYPRYRPDSNAVQQSRQNVHVRSRVRAEAGVLTWRPKYLQVPRSISTLSLIWR